MEPVEPLVDPLPEEVEPVGGTGVASTTQVPLTVAAVAARLGVAPSTLRTWDRRYGLGPSGRAAGSHRRYTAEDVARLETMRRLTLAGAAPSDAARVAADNAPGLVPVPAGLGEEVVPPHVDALTLAAAAAKGEEPRLRRMVASVVRERGLVGAWTDVGHEALRYLAGRDPADKPGRDPESLLAGAILAAARSYAEAPGDVEGPEVVLWVEPSVLPDLLGAHVLAAALTQRGVRARVARAGEGPGRLARVAGATTTAVVAVVGAPPRGEELARAAAERGDVVVFLIGSQAPVVWLPGVHRVRTYAGALHEIVGALVDLPSAEADDEPVRGPS